MNTTIRRDIMSLDEIVTAKNCVPNVLLYHEGSCIRFMCFELFLMHGWTSILSVWSTKQEETNIQIYIALRWEYDTDVRLWKITRKFTMPTWDMRTCCLGLDYRLTKILAEIQVRCCKRNNIFVLHILNLEK